MDQVKADKRDIGTQPSANDDSTVDWKTCPICVANGAKSPCFKEFMPRIRHLIEHSGLPVLGTEIHFPDPLEKVEEQIYGKKTKLTARQQRSALIAAARRFLPVIADWLEEAVTEPIEKAELGGGGIVTANRLAELVHSIPDRHEEQQRFLLHHKRLLRSTAQDPRWPKDTPTQPRFLATSMAGAEWNLSASTSREYIRRDLPKKTRPAVDKRKNYERRPKRGDGRVVTNANYED